MKKLTLIALVLALVPASVFANGAAADNKENKAEPKAKTAEVLKFEAAQKDLDDARKGIADLEKAASEAQVKVDEVEKTGVFKKSWRTVKAQGSDLKSVVTGHKVSTAMIMAITLGLVKAAEYVYNNYVAVEAKDAAQIASDAKLAAQLQAQELKAKKN